MIWLAGCKGMLGSEISLELKSSGIDFIESDNETDLASLETVERFIADKDIDWIINCSAYTAVDKAEDDKENAYSVNEHAVSNLAVAAGKNDAKLVHFSTDYVYDGKKSTPYKEDDVTFPGGVYGDSKLAGEKKLEGILDKYFIFRISWLYGAHGKNFVNTMLNLFMKKDCLSVVDDQFGSPTSADELASFIVQRIKDDSENYGIYHFSGEGETSWYEFACEIFRLAVQYGLVDRKVNIKPVNSSVYPTKAKRPAYSYMSKEKLFETFGYRPKDWRETLEVYMSSMKGV